MKNEPISREVLKRIPRCPTTGGGVHRWLFQASIKLHRAGVPKEEMAPFLVEATASCGRIVTAIEIENAIENSSPEKLKARPYKDGIPPHSEALLASIVSASDLVVPDLPALSSRPITDLTTEAVLDILFPGDPLLALGLSKAVCATRFKSEWRKHLRIIRYIVPSPMLSRTGKTQNGKVSVRALESVGPRRFLVVESDTTTLDHQARVLLHLGTMAPLSMIVHSGNKSLHGWYFCLGQTEEKVGRFFRYAQRFKADPKMITKNQLARIPGGIRDNGIKQQLLYLNERTIN